MPASFVVDAEKPNAVGRSYDFRSTSAAAVSANIKTALTVDVPAPVNTA